MKATKCFVPLLCLVFGSVPESPFCLVEQLKGSKELFLRINESSDVRLMVAMLALRQRGCSSLPSGTEYAEDQVFEVFTARLLTRMFFLVGPVSD